MVINVRAVIYATDAAITLLALSNLVFLAELRKRWIQRDDRYIPLHALVKSLSGNSDKDPRAL